MTSANIISGLDPQELDRPRLSAKTACPKLDALANAASFAINSSIGGWLLAADGLGVRVCRAGGSAAHTALEVFSETYGLCAPFGDYPYLRRVAAAWRVQKKRACSTYDSPVVPHLSTKYA